MHRTLSHKGGWYDIWSGDVSDAKGFRFISTGDLNLGENVVINHVLTYGNVKDHGDWLDKEELFSFVARPTYNWSPYNKTMLEVGYFDQEKLGIQAPKTSLVAQNSLSHTPSQRESLSSLVQKSDSLRLI